MNIEARLQSIKVWLCDVDGVLTDGRIVLDHQGNELKVFDVRDGHGLAMLNRHHIRTGVITGRSSEALTLRARELGFSWTIQGSRDKLADLQHIASEAEVELHEIAYMGDDLIDLPVLSRVGFAAAPSDAHPEVLRHVHHVATRPGGRGAVREMTDMLMKTQGIWEPMLAALLEGKCVEPSRG